MALGFFQVVFELYPLGDRHAYILHFFSCFWYNVHTRVEVGAKFTTCCVCVCVCVCVPVHVCMFSLSVFCSLSLLSLSLSLSFDSC